MENLPPEILVKIFLFLPAVDIPAVTNTCYLWKSIVQNFHIWKILWFRLLKEAENTDYIDVKLLMETYFNHSDFPRTVLRVYNLLKNKLGKIYTCHADDGIKTFSSALLMTHHSRAILKCCNEFSADGVDILTFLNKSRVNEILSHKKQYVDFRSPPKLIDSIHYLFENYKSRHIHVKLLVYAYPMGLSDCLKKFLLKVFFENCHIEELICIPRVLLLCENLYVQDAVVVYSTSRTTEIAVIINGCVDDRWCEIPVGGWNVATHLYSSYRWLNPTDKIDIKHFDGRHLKKNCFIKVSANNTNSQVVNMFCKQRAFGESDREHLLTKCENFQAPEVMYAEMNLCAEIKRLINGLPDDTLDKCLSHVLLTGGNCKLKFLNDRIHLDLLRALPKFASIINTTYHDDKDLVYFSNEGLPKMRPTYRFIPGQKSRFRREDYILGAT